MKCLALTFLIFITACGTFEEKNELLVPPVFEKEYKEYKENKKIEANKKETKEINNLEIKE